MKYSEMVKFLNDNGILVMQPVIASEVSNQLEFDISEEAFEAICAKVYDLYLSCYEEPDIWELVNDELREYKYNRLEYLREKERVCGLDKMERWELTELESLED